MYANIAAMVCTQLIGAIIYQPNVLGTTYYKALKLKHREPSIFEWILVTLSAYLEMTSIAYSLELMTPSSLFSALSNSIYLFLLFIVPTQAVHFPFDQRSYTVLWIYLLHHGLVYVTNTCILYTWQ